MKRAITICIIISLPLFVLSQTNTINPDGYNVFYHQNGQKSSEGNMKNGKPDGYWKTYNEEGILVSEGNRKNFMLDSLWRFYNDLGELVMEISYREDKKNGPRLIYRDNDILEENFVDDVKSGPTNYYFANGSLKKTIPFIEGLEEGLAKEYSSDGRIITIIAYKKGFITERQRINRYDQQNLKHGKWKYFYPNDLVKREGKYKHGTMHGYFKDYDKEGNLISTAKYIDGEKQEDVAELVKLEIRKDYYPNGKVKVMASYKDGVPEGVRREYSTEGEIEKAYIFKHGVVIGEGIITEKGERDGFWKEFFDDGKLKAEGNYQKDKRLGEWKFYHQNGMLEQIGSYNDEGKFVGEWKWFYDNGNKLRTESYYNGLADGLMTEYDELGNILAQGEYIDGLENDFWFYDYGDIKMEGDYVDGMRNGVWKHYYPDNSLSFEGKFIDDNPNGKHTWYWPNGNIKDEGYYVMGRKDGEWKKFNKEGVIIISITYEKGREKKYDGIRINHDNQ